jgi:sugar phosphate isomerase/epimerase
MHTLRLEQMTMFDVEPAEVVTIAAEFNIPKISLWTTTGIDGARPVTAANKKSVLDRLRDLPVTVDTVEAYVLGTPADEVERGLAIAADMDAKAAIVVNFLTPDESQAADQLAAFAGLAHEYGLLASLEPIYMGVTRSLAEGERLIRKAGVPNLRLTADLLHIFRTGTPLPALGATDPVLISSAQICDGPPSVDEKDHVEEGAFTRMVPGTGCFPVMEFLRTIPATVPLGIEVPMRKLRESGVPARERTRMIVEATRALQQKAAH